MGGNPSANQAEGTFSRMAKSFYGGWTLLKATASYWSNGETRTDLESAPSPKLSQFDVIRPGGPEPPPHSVLPTRPPIPSQFNQVTLASSFPLRSSTNAVHQRTATAPSSPTLAASSSSAPSLDMLVEATNRMRRGSNSPDGIRKKYQPREHIFAKSHKAEVQANLVKEREEMSKEIYQIKRSSGYSATYQEFQEFLNYGAKLEGHARDSLSPSPSLTNLHARPPALAGRRRHTLSEDVTPAFLARALLKAKETLNAPKPPKPFTPTFDQLRLVGRAKDAEIEARLRAKPAPLPPTLPPADEAEVDALFRKRGLLSKCVREQVTDKDLSRLQPGQWLNDEIINFYGQMILSRSETVVQGTGKESTNGKQAVEGRKAPLNVHYFSTFFWAKLKGEGYEKGRLAKWTKKFDLFAKDVVLIPINHNNAHWTGAAINFRKKRIESYDSMGMPRQGVYKTLRAYLDAEHRNKKKKPFDFTGWEDYSLDDTPQQENGFDCGVFTCNFLESLSRGEETFNFTQKDMKYIRRRMAWEIGRAQLQETTS